MERMNIKEFEITKGMYEEAKRIERMEDKLKKLDCRTEDFKKLNHEAIKASELFEEKFTDDFDTLEVVNEYERRERNKIENQGDRKMEKSEKKFIKKIVVVILEIKSKALGYTAEDFDNSYAAEKFAEEVSNEINFYIDKMINKNVNQNVISQLKHLDFELWNRNFHLN